VHSKGWRRDEKKRHFGGKTKTPELGNTSATKSCSAVGEKKGPWDEQESYHHNFNRPHLRQGGHPSGRTEKRKIISSTLFIIKKKKKAEVLLTTFFVFYGKGAKKQNRRDEEKRKGGEESGNSRLQRQSGKSQKPGRITRQK